MMVKVLVAEDEQPIREGLKDLLEGEGYNVYTASDGEEALSIYQSEFLELALLDIMMPKVSGYDVCKEIRKTDERLPVIFLSAKEEEIDKVLGLELGADDYIVKPFGVRELLARIKTVLRRSQADTRSKETAQSFVIGNWKVEPGAYKLQSRVSPHLSHDLTGKEVSLLVYFNQNPGIVLTRDALLEKFWGTGYSGTTRTLDQHIAKLRQKIEERPADPKHILTVHGSGYRFVPGPGEE